MDIVKNIELMRGVFVVFSIFLASLSAAANGPETKNASVELYKAEAETIFSELTHNNASLPSFDVFSVAYKGYKNLKIDTQELKRDILTVIDFSLSSNEKRMWVIDLEEKRVLFNDLVAHGRNSGNEFAGIFSNVPQTNMSSLGFYVTGTTYHGKHGLSMFLHGKDKGFNDNAKKRAIVLHGASYVSESFIKKYGRLGRSFGCPSVPMNIYKDLIHSIADGTCLYIYYPDENYFNKSAVLIDSPGQP